MTLPAHTAGTSGYHVTINSTSCQKRSWWILNGQELTAGREVRVRTQARPGVTGRQVGKSYTDLRDVTLEMEFDGNYDPADEANTDPEVGLDDNIAAFEDAVVYDAGDARSRLDVTVESKGSTWTGLLQVISFERGDGLADCTALLRVHLPAGRLELSGS